MDAPIRPLNPAPSGVSAPRTDAHVHFIGENPACGNHLSPRKKNSLLGRYFMWRLGYNGKSSIEDFYLHRLLSHLADPENPIRRVILLGLDAVHDPDGTRRLDRTEFALSNDYLIELGRRHPALIPAVSIHPYRRDAIDELERCFEAGARFLKWLPNSQDFDPADSRIKPFYRRLADRGMIVITHTGFEHTIRPYQQSYGDPARLATGLDMGVRMIAAHSGSSGILHRMEYFDAFLEMLNRFPNLYGDLSAFTSVARFPYLRRLLDDAGAPWDRLIHGSDYPILPTPWLFADRLGFDRARRLGALSNPLKMDYEIKRALGVPESCFTLPAQWKI